MAQPATLSGEEIQILVGNGASPEVFSHPCLINSDRGFSRTANTIQETIPDCTNVSAPAWVSTDVDGLSASISGGGVIDLASVEMFDEWYETGAAKNVKVKLNKVGGRTYTGSFRLSEFAYTGTRKNKATCSISLVSTGPVLGVDNT